MRIEGFSPLYDAAATKYKKVATTQDVQSAKTVLSDRLELSSDAVSMSSIMRAGKSGSEYLAHVQDVAARVKSGNYQVEPYQTASKMLDVFLP